MSVRLLLLPAPVLVPQHVGTLISSRNPGCSSPRMVAKILALPDVLGRQVKEQELLGVSAIDRPATRRARREV